MTAGRSAPPSREVAALALVSLPEVGPAHVRSLLARWPDPVAAAEAVGAGRGHEALCDMARNMARPGARALGSTWAAALDLPGAAARLAAHPARVLVTGDEGFPVDPALPDAPAVLLVAGERPEALDRPRVAIVGTRAATPAGLADAGTLASALAEEGVTVVSGLAIGIDGAAHRGAVDAGGLTVGVVATGLDVVYPRRHGLLFGQVRRAGVLVSESAYGTPPARWRFPVRNRIIAGLADVVVVVEATATGGARITAEQGLAYGRPVLAQPGSRRNPAAAGCNALIADGAQPLLDPSDVVVALGMTPGSRRGWNPGTARPRPTGTAGRVLRALAGEPATLDQLASRTRLTAPEVAVAVSSLDRDGWVERSRGMVWPR